MIIVPHTDLTPETHSAVPNALFVEVESADGYRELLRSLWQAGDAFTLVEHDVVPTTEQLDALDHCEKSWCYYTYFPGQWIPMFGCVRFSADLIADTQGVWNDESWMWNQLDMRFFAYARERGWRAHWHYPHVSHVGSWPNAPKFGDALWLNLIQREAKRIKAAA